MQLTVEKRFALPVSPEQAWAVLSDLRSVGACMPGARVDELLDARRCRGVLECEVGPARMQLAGVVEMTGSDETRREVHLVAEGVEAGATRATADVTARIEAAGFADECRLVGSATLEVTGAIEQLGQRVLAPASDAVLSVFARNFAAAARTVPSRRSGAGATRPTPSGPESTLTLLVQGGQAPGAAVAPHAEGPGTSVGTQPPAAGGAGSLRARLRGWFGAKSGPGSGPHG
jgi:carbon monoxide dehydrogenase subunit G